MGRSLNFGPFSYPSARNVPFDGRNKTVRLIFIPVKFEPEGAIGRLQTSADNIHVATILTTLVKNA